MVNQKILDTPQIGIMHLNKIGFANHSACGKKSESKTWNLSEVTCGNCMKSNQYKDSEYFKDIGSRGREIRYISD